MTLSMTDKKAVRSEHGAWPAGISAEFERNRGNACVGSVLLSESERVRVWMIRLQPGERIGFHRHVLDYFWTAVTAGRGRQHVHDGSTVEHSYVAGETRNERYGPGQYKIHDLENVGDTDLVFTTVEFLDGANPPLPIPNAVRFAPE